MIKLKNLFEFKQVGIIYHFTTEDRAEMIARSNELKVGKYSEKNKYTNKKEYYISFTRNKAFNKINRIIDGELDVGFAIDGTKLSHKYKIKPYNYYNDPKWKEEYGKKVSLLNYDEDEERIWVGENQNFSIKNFNEYVIKVLYKGDDDYIADILKKKFKNVEAPNVGE